MLMSQGMDAKLGSMQRLGLRLHLIMCSGCRNLNRQMAFLHEGCQRFASGQDGRK